MLFCEREGPNFDVSQSTAPAVFRRLWKMVVAEAGFSLLRTPGLKVGNETETTYKIIWILEIAIRGCFF